MASKEKDPSGLTPEETKIMTDLRRLHEAYMALPAQHPTERQNLNEAIQRIASLVALRAARRTFPDHWPTYGQDPNGRWVQK